MLSGRRQLLVDICVGAALLIFLSFCVVMIVLSRRHQEQHLAAQKAKLDAVRQATILESAWDHRGDCRHYLLELPSGERYEYTVYQHDPDYAPIGQPGEVWEIRSNAKGERPVLVQRLSGGG